VLMLDQQFKFPLYISMNIMFSSSNDLQFDLEPTKLLKRDISVQTIPAASSRYKEIVDL
jgi:hypothetical protein